VGRAATVVVVLVVVAVIVVATVRVDDVFGVDVEKEAGAPLVDDEVHDVIESSSPTAIVRGTVARRVNTARA